MTLAFGILCDEGVCLVTDSIALDHEGTATVDDETWFARNVSARLLTHGKFFPSDHWASQSHFRAAYAGYREPGNSFWVPGNSPSGDWKDTARNFMSGLTRGVGPPPRLQWSSGAPMPAAQEAVIAPTSHPRDGGPLMGLFDWQGNEHWLDRPGILSTLMARPWFESQVVEMPSDLESATRLALRMGAEVVRITCRGLTLEQILESGQAPSMAFPLHYRCWRWDSPAGQGMSGRAVELGATARP